MGVAGRNKYRKDTSKAGEDENMIGYQQRQRIFYISDKSEKEILINSVQTTRIMIFGGIVLSVIGLIGIIDNFI